jgi:hypothetical protein
VALDARLGIVILGLLACNTAYYIIAGRLSVALESVAWYALLILFTLEAVHGQRPRSVRALAAIHGVRLLATLTIAVTAVLYVREKEWLDASNLFLWIAVVALLEVEVRRPAAIAAHRKVFTLTAALLYAALGALVLIWLVRGDWMDAWDAALWLSAFGLLELDVLSRQGGYKNIV